MSELIDGKITKSEILGTHLEPSYEGVLSGRQVRNVKKYLRRYQWLRVWWGFAPSAKRFSYRNIMAVAQFGDAEDPSWNRKIVTREIFADQSGSLELAKD